MQKRQSVLKNEDFMLSNFTVSSKSDNKENTGVIDFTKPDSNEHKTTSGPDMQGLFVNFPSPIFCRRVLWTFSFFFLHR